MTLASRELPVVLVSKGRKASRAKLVTLVTPVLLAVQGYKDNEVPAVKPAPQVLPRTV